MKAVLLDGSRAGDTTGERVRAALETRIRARGYDIEHVPLRERTIGPCMGDFFCFVRTPGVCMLDDDNRAIAASVARSDLLVLLTPVAFGGYAPLLKRAVDHLVQNVSPGFATVDGETHHAPRYATYPSFLAVGWQDAPHADDEALFHQIAAGNAVNFHSPHAGSAVVAGSADEDRIAATLDAALARLDAPRASATRVAPPPGVPGPAIAPRRALLLVGSPRGRKSTSHSLGQALLEGLGAKGVETRTALVYPAVASPERTQALLDDVAAADLVVLAFPLYVDSLPAPVLDALERIAAARREATDHKRFVAIANCGFPEARHNASALAQCASFARQARLAWAGGLALGGGEGIVRGVPLAELGGRGRPVARVVAHAAEVLAAGESLSDSVQRPWNAPYMPTWLYRLAGRFGWWQQARRWGMSRALGRTPYAS